MGEGVQPGLAQEEQVHQLAVVRRERRPVLLALVVDRHAQHGPASFGPRRGAHAEGTVQTLLDAALHAVPPALATPERPSEEERGGRGDDEGAAPPAGIRFFPGSEHALAHGRAHDGDRPREQEQPQAGQHHAEPLVHPQDPARNRRDRHQDVPGAGGSLDVDAHAVGGRGHQPELRRPRGGCAGNGLGGVRRGRALGAGRPLDRLHGD